MCTELSRRLICFYSTSNLGCELKVLLPSFLPKRKEGGGFININPKIEAAFADFTVGTKPVPIAFLSYTGKADTYLTYYTWFCKPDNFYDDENHTEIAYGTIDIYSKGNFKDILKKVKNTLKENGFIWTDNGPEVFERDTGYYHVPVNFCTMGEN